MFGLARCLAGYVAVKCLICFLRGWQYRRVTNREWLCKSITNHYSFILFIYFFFQWRSRKYTEIEIHSLYFSNCLFSVIVWLLTIELGIFPHVKNGFYCDDRSISQKTHGDTLSTGLLISSMFLVYPILWICEAMIYKPVSLKSSRFGGSASMAWLWFREYIFAMILHLFVVDACKVMTNRNWRGYDADVLTICIFLLFVV